MAKNLRDKALRQIVASLICGGFNENETRELCMLLRDDSFTEELISALREVSRLLGEKSSKKPEKNERPIVNESVKQVLELLKLAHITQRELIDLFATITPEFGESARRGRDSNAELIERFFRSSGPGQRNEFLMRLRKRAEESIGPNDPYLDLISQRLSF